MRPKASPEGPREAGIGQRRGCLTAFASPWAPADCFGSHLPGEGTAPPFRGRAPKRVALGAPRSGDRAASGMPERAPCSGGARTPLRGRIFPSEDTAPLYAVATIRVIAFRTSHPPKPRLAPAGDLFRASLDRYSPLAARNL